MQQTEAQQTEHRSFAGRLTWYGASNYAKPS